jgi:hypothetical protein
MSGLTAGRRNPMFAMSDIGNAAEDFIAALSEHAPSPWHEEDREALVESLVDRAFAVLNGGAEVDFS